MLTRATTHSRNRYGALLLRKSISVKRTFVLTLIILALNGCEGTYVKFEEPQPESQTNLKRIPKQLRGSYISTYDSTYLTIDDQAIVDWTDIKYKTLTDSLDLAIDSTKIEERTSDFINIIDGKYKLNLKRFGDSVLVHYSYRDTLFKISDRHILRRFKGHYFLNYKKSDANWKVRRLTLNRKELSFSKVRIPEDIATLQQITEIQEVKSDSGKVIGYKLNPSKKELKKLMKHSFSETKTYRKMK